MQTHAHEEGLKTETNYNIWTEVIYASTKTASTQGLKYVNFIFDVLQYTFFTLGMIC